LKANDPLLFKSSVDAKTTSIVNDEKKQIAFDRKNLRDSLFRSSQIMDFPGLCVSLREFWLVLEAQSCQKPPGGFIPNWKDNVANNTAKTPIPFLSDSVNFSFPEVKDRSSLDNACCRWLLTGA
jgi:hypothetical protein